MKMFIDIHVPVTRCNFNCHYCYVPQINMKGVKETPMKYSPEHIGKALSAKRLGGICHINMCGLGETLIPNYIVDVTTEILKQGHYVMIVTNGTLTERFKQFIELPLEYRTRLGFKFSFHYLELKRLNLMDKFFNNIQLIRDNGMSFSLEMTPCDELEPYIDEIKDICMKRVGAYCHLTIPRNEKERGIVLLSKHSLKEFCEIWKEFDSDLFNYKASHWEEKRCEFCYAGAWTGLLNLGNGYMRPCSGQEYKQNIFENIDKPIKIHPVGHHCAMPHCYNAHSLLGLGCIPEIAGNYANERDRVDQRNGEHWLTQNMYNFLSEGLVKENTEYSEEEKEKADKYISKFQYVHEAKQFVKKIIRKN